MGAPRKPHSAVFFGEAASREESEAIKYHFSRDQVSKLSLFAQPEQRRRMQKKTMIYMENAGIARMEPALRFLQKVFTAGIPPQLNIVSQRDKNATMQIVICKNRGRRDTLRLEVETKCIFRNTLTEHVYAEGTAKMVFGMHDQKVRGKWGYELEFIETRSWVIAAFFSDDERLKQEAVREICGHLEVPEAGFRNTG